MKTYVRRRCMATRRSMSIFGIDLDNRSTNRSAAALEGAHARMRVSAGAYFQIWNKKKVLLIRCKGVGLQKREEKNVLV